MALENKSNLKKNTAPFKVLYMVQDYILQGLEIGSKIQYI